MKRSEVGTRLSHARGEAGLSRQKLADKSGVSKNLIQKYEENRSRFSIYSFCKICSGLKVDPFEILDPDVYNKFFSQQDKFLSLYDGDMSSSSEEGADRVTELGDQAFHKFLTDEFLTEEVQDYFKENLPPETVVNMLEEVSTSNLTNDWEVYRVLHGDVSPELSDLIYNYCSLNDEGRKLVEDLCQALTGNPALRS